MNDTKTVKPKTDCRWLPCRGCGGEVGVPLDWAEDNVACPECGPRVQIRSEIQYRAPSEKDDSQKQVPEREAKVSNTFLNEDSSLGFGLASIVLGWTLIVPFLGFLAFINTC